MTEVPPATATGPVAEGAPRLVDQLDLQLGRGATPAGCLWLLGQVTVTDQAKLQAAALLVADAHMRMRSETAPAYELWRNRVASGAPHPGGTDRQRIEPFVEDAFGLPERPLPDSQVEGYVAQVLWHQIISELAMSPDGEAHLRHLEDVGFSVLEPGGDGLAVYETKDGALRFRLWEIKKHATARHVSATIAQACDQLSLRGRAYLAKLTGIGKGYTGDLGLLYASLVDLWLDAAPVAGVGVAIATSESHVPKRGAFGGLTGRFPQFDQAGQREGLFAAIGDFPAFARAVRDLVWSGL